MLGLRCGSRVALDCPRDFLEAPELRRRYSGVQCARSIGPVRCRVLARTAWIFCDTG